MILEVEHAVETMREVLATGLIDAAVQSAEEGISSHVVPHWADGDLVMVDGVLNIDLLARIIVEHQRTANPGNGE